MKKTTVLTAIAAAASLVSMSVSAAEAGSTMEKCHVNQAGKGMIVAGKADCKTTSHACAGQNVDDDEASWIWVPTGECIKVNEGNFSGLPKNIQAKIEGTDASGATIG